MSNGENLAQESKDNKIAEFNNELRALQDKHNLVIIPKLTVNTFGILPVIDLMDKDEYIRRTSGGEG